MSATTDGYAAAIIAEGQRRAITERGMVMALATALVESELVMYANYGDPESLNFPHEAISYDANSVGLFQQRAPWWGTCADRMDPTRSAGLFYASLVEQRIGNDDYNTAATTAGGWCQMVQQSDYPDRYDDEMHDAQLLYNRLTGGGTVAAWTGDPTWLEEVLRPALGARLVTLAGWEDSGHGDFLDIRGVMWHHTGNSRETAESIRRGRSDLPGPLSNLHIAPDGTVTIVAVGVCWHAGKGSYPWLPTDNANAHMIGVECAWPTIESDGSYDVNERWPDAQIQSMRDTAAALTLKLGQPATRNIGHKEWAGSSQGKWDPGNLDMPWFRGEVAKDMRGEFDLAATPPPPAPAPIPPPLLPGPINARSDRELIEETWEQLRGPGGNGWPQLGGKTVVDAIAALSAKLDAYADRK